MLPKSPGFRLDGMRAPVTGAGRGIGLACAAALAEAGAEVVLAARTLADVEAGAGAIVAAGGGLARCGWMWRISPGPGRRLPVPDRLTCW